MQEKLSLNKSGFIILFSGQFTHRKGIDLLLNVLTKFKKPNIDLILAGGRIEDLYSIGIQNIPNNVKIVGFLNKDELIEYYSLADLFILPTRLDTWGVVVNEAIACGCPIAVSKFAGCADDLINDRINGYIFNPLDENDFYNTIIEIIRNRKYLSQMAELAKEKLMVYNHKIAAERIAEFINQLGKNA